jgi:hypothetical protein
MRVAFYIDNITFHANAQDSDEYFNKPNSYKTLIEILSQFVYDTMDVKMKNLDINNI